MSLYSNSKFQVNAWTPLKSIQIKYNFLSPQVHKLIQHWPFHYLKWLSGTFEFRMVLFAENKANWFYLSNAKSAFHQLIHNEVPKKIN